MTQRISLSPDGLLPGEDRTFGGNFLYVDLVPSTSFMMNIRSSIRPADWNQLRRLVYDRAGNRCEICKNGAGRVEAHERWDFQDQTRVQRIRRLICLCRACHSATHYGLASIQNRDAQARLHIQRVNGWSAEDTNNHIEAAYELWHHRSRVKWSLDLGMLTAAGISLLEPILEPVWS